MGIEAGMEGEAGEGKQWHAEAEAKDQGEDPEGCKWPGELCKTSRWYGAERLAHYKTRWGIDRHGGNVCSLLRSSYGDRGVEARSVTRNREGAGRDRY